MSSYNAISVIAQAIETEVQHAGEFRLRILTESDEQVAISIIDALEEAGFEIVRRAEAPSP